MSRIGKKIIVVPEKVEVKVHDGHIVVKGPKGQMERDLPNEISIDVKDKKIEVKQNSKSSGNLWGTSRTLIQNMVTGVSQGFKKDLEFNGVGYKASVKSNVITLSLGYSHPIDFTIPKGISIEVDKNIITVSGCDKELIGFVSAKIRSFRPPEPYKGKGIKYANETITRKAGKTGAKAK